MKRLLSIIVAIVAFTQMALAYNYDFSATVPSGQTLYFKFSTGGKVIVTYPNYHNPDFYYNYSKPTGDLVIPASIAVNGVTWDIVGIDRDAFERCAGLTSVTIECPGSIGQDAFRDCTGLTSLTIGDSISSIGGLAFQGCNNINTVIIGENVSFIGLEAFSDCSNLNTVIIGGNVSSIGDYGFSGCYSLANIIIFATTPPNASSSTFNGVSANCSIIVPSGSSTAYGTATGWSQFANIAEMSSSITANVYSSNAMMGAVSVSQIANIFTLTATANENYQFVQWNY